MLCYVNIFKKIIFFNFKVQEKLRTIRITIIVMITVVHVMCIAFMITFSLIMPKRIRNKSVHTIALLIRKIRLSFLYFQFISKTVAKQYTIGIERGGIHVNLISV